MIKNRLGKTLNCAALNVVWNLIGGSRYEYDDAKMLKLIGMFLKSNILSP